MCVLMIVVDFAIQEVSIGYEPVDQVMLFDMDHEIVDLEGLQRMAKYYGIRSENCVWC